MGSALARQPEYYTMDDINNLPEGKRAELIDGELYMMAAPGMTHQRILMELAFRIRDYIGKNKGDCEVFPAPFAVFLNADDRIYVEPDISVICDKDSLDESGYHGAPDWAIEIVSPSTEWMDYGIKLFKYRSAGVREYWIVNPQKRTVNVYDFERDEKTRQYDFDEPIFSCIYPDLGITIADLLR